MKLTSTTYIHSSKRDLNKNGAKTQYSSQNHFTRSVFLLSQLMIQQFPKFLVTKASIVK